MSESRTGGLDTQAIEARLARAKWIPPQDEADVRDIRALLVEVEALRTALRDILVMHPGRPKLEAFERARDLLELGAPERDR